MVSWKDMSRREKVMVLGGGLLILTLSFYAVLVKPVRDEYVRLKEDVPAKRADLFWMRSVAAERREVFSRPGGTGTASLLKRVDQAARRFGISGNLVDIEPAGSSGARLRFDNVLFTDFMRCLRFLTSEGLFAVNSISVERTDSEGYVSARISLEQR